MPKLEKRSKLSLEKVGKIADWYHNAYTPKIAKVLVLEGIRPDQWERVADIQSIQWTKEGLVITVI